jgi:hypothetical protein
MNASTLTIYRQLSNTLGQDQAQLIVELVQAQVSESTDEKLKELATRSDIKASLADVRAEMAETKADILKYVIGVYLTGFLMLAGAIIGLYFKH